MWPELAEGSENPEYGLDRTGGHHLTELAKNLANGREIAERGENFEYGRGPPHRIGRLGFLHG